MEKEKKLLTCNSLNQWFPTFFCLLTFEGIADYLENTKLNNNLLVKNVMILF